MNSTKLSDYGWKVVKTKLRSISGFLVAMMKSKFTDESFGDRMKRYERATTETLLDHTLPVYVRIDMRAGHTFCRGLKKPFDEDYASAMKEATRYLVDKTGAILGYTQSDEISLVYENTTKMPFGSRLFKLESVFASMATAAFIVDGMKTSLKDRIMANPPSFDCRVINLPNLDEAVNMVLWRVKDCFKNSVTLLALEHFSNKEIHKKDTDDKIKMLRGKNVYWDAYPEYFRYGSFFVKEQYSKTFSIEEVANMKKRPPLDMLGRYVVTRSKVVNTPLLIPNYIEKQGYDSIYKTSFSKVTSIVKTKITNIIQKYIDKHKKD